MKTKKTIITILTLLLILSFPLTALAHSGRTDSRGGHRDNRNKSGLGFYHYHCGGYPAHLHPGSLCPYRNPQRQVKFYNNSIYKF